MSPRFDYHYARQQKRRIDEQKITHNANSNHYQNSLSSIPKHLINNDPIRQRCLSTTAKNNHQVNSHDYGRLWGRGYETFYDENNEQTTNEPPTRRIIQIVGNGATTYLQNLVTADVTLSEPYPLPRSEPIQQPKQPPPSPNDDDDIIETTANTPHNNSNGEIQYPVVEFSSQLRSVCFLDHKGRIITDALLWKISEHEYYIDVPSSTYHILYQHLQQFKLRKSKISIHDTTHQMYSGVIYGTLSSKGAPSNFYTGLDPRHPSLGLRILKKLDANDSENGPKSISEMFRHISLFPYMKGNYELVRRLVGVAEGIEIYQKIPLECNLEFLNAISYSKGCYLGQELTARTHHTGSIRKRILPIYLIDTDTQIPPTWSMVSSFQEGRNKRKFTLQELQYTIPSRLPRLSVSTAGTLVALMTASVNHNSDNNNNNEEIQKVQKKAEQLLDRIQVYCQLGSKIYDEKSNQMIGQIVSAPVFGTNVLLAMIRLESVGLINHGVWSKTNKVRIIPPPTSSSNNHDSNDEENDDNHGSDEKDHNHTENQIDNIFRYLPYVPLWWPEIDNVNGKEKQLQDDGTYDYSNEAFISLIDETTGDDSSDHDKTKKNSYSRIVIEQLPYSDESNDKVRDTSPSASSK